MAPGDKVINEYPRQQKADGEEQQEPLWKDKVLFGVSRCQIEEVISENPPVAGKGCTERQHRGTEHGSTRTGSTEAVIYKHQTIIHMNMVHMSQCTYSYFP